MPRQRRVLRVRFGDGLCIRELGARALEVGGMARIAELRQVPLGLEIGLAPLQTRQPLRPPCISEVSAPRWMEGVGCLRRRQASRALACSE